MLINELEQDNEHFEFDILNSPNMYLSIRNIVFEGVSNEIEKNSKSMNELTSRLRSNLNFCEMKKRDTFKLVAGADAGSQILPFAIGRYAIISALVYSLQTGKRFFPKPKFISSSRSDYADKFKGIVNLRRETMLFETALSYVENNPEISFLMLDGPLAFSNMWNLTGKKKDHKRLIDAINALLEACWEKEIILVGVVKRPSARYFIYNNGLHKETHLSDSFLLLQVLNPGERTEIFSPKAALKKEFTSSPFIDAINIPIYSFYGRFSSEWYLPPLRIDLPLFALDHLEDIADYCYCNSFNEGVPLPIVKADEEVRISKNFVRTIYSDIVNDFFKKTLNVTSLAPFWGEGKWMGI